MNLENPTRRLEAVYDAAYDTFKRDECLQRLNTIQKIQAAKTIEVVGYHPGRRVKELFLVRVADEAHEAFLIAKSYKRFLPQRFAQETLLRHDSDLESFAPLFVSTSERTNRTAKNRSFAHGDYQIFFEEFVKGQDLADLIQHPAMYRTHVSLCANQYINACHLLHQNYGRTLTNINPRNIRLPSQKQRDPVIVDWGGQSSRSGLDAAHALIIDNVLNINRE